MTKANPKLFLWSITAALAGFLFGFDTVVISGAEQKIQDLWGLSSGLHGLAISMALWGTVIGSLIGSWPTDRFGRKKLSFGSASSISFPSFGYIASLGLCAWAFYSENFAIVPTCIFAFIAAHAVGQGAVIWVFISEIFPNRHRAQGQSLGSFTHWIFAALLTLFFPSMVEKFHPGTVFAFFCFMMVLQLLWVKLAVPETNGCSLEEIEHDLEMAK